MSTQLQMVNKLLRRLREDTVDTVISSDYSILLLDFINEARETVTSAHDWRRYRYLSYIRIPASGGASTVADASALDANGGDVMQGPVMNGRSKLIWHDQSTSGVLFNKNAYSGGVNNNDWIRVAPLGFNEYQQAIMLLGGPTADNAILWPTYVSFTFDDTTEAAPAVYMYPPAQSEGMIQVLHWTPPADLAVDGTDENTELQVPEVPVFEYALMLALNERGEELGEPGNVQERRFYDALHREIETDLDFEQRTNKYDWRRD